MAKQTVATAAVKSALAFEMANGDSTAVSNALAAADSNFTELYSAGANVAFTGVTGGATGAAGLVPAPGGTASALFLKNDGTWAAPAAMTGATGGATGAAGLVPAPGATANQSFLRGDGTFPAVPFSDANGNTVFGTAALATNATNGFIYLPTCAGTPSGAATGQTGCVPMVIDTTASKIWVRIGSTWKSATVA